MSNKNISNDDVNAMLLATITASTESVKASEQWVMRASKRSGNAASKGALKRSKVRSDMDAVEKNTRFSNTEHNTEDGAASSGVGHSNDNSACVPELLPHRLMEYVIERGLGGRHNSSQGDRSDFLPPPRASLLAETSKMCTAAVFNIHHAVYGNTSSTQSERALETIVRYRKKLHVCSYSRDIVGGFVDGARPHTRAHLFALVTKSLQNDETTDGPPQPQKPMENEKEEVHDSHGVVLFDSARRHPVSSFLQDSSEDDDE